MEYLNINFCNLQIQIRNIQSCNISMKIYNSTINTLEILHFYITNAIPPIPYSNYDLR